MFLKQTTVSEVIFHNLSKEEEKSFRIDDSHEITLKGLPDVQVNPNYFRRGLFQVTVTWEVTPTKKVLPMFESLAASRLPDGSKREEADNQYFDEEGKFKEGFGIKSKKGYILNLLKLPNPMQVFINEKVNELSNFTENFIRVLRWRTNVSGPHQMPNPGLFEWSLDQQEWYFMPEPMEPKELEWADILKFSDEVEKDLREFYKTRIEVPLGHELFYEAWSQIGENPRSSLMLGIAALEVGVKECIAILAPDTKWLVDNLASPPIVRLLGEYLPTLTAKNTIKGLVLAPPPKIIEEIKKGVNLRNNLVHKGAQPLKYESLRDILLAIKDAIWLCNYYMGFEWAWKNIRQSTRLELDPDSIAYSEVPRSSPMY